MLCLWKTKLNVWHSLIYYMFVKVSLMFVVYFANRNTHIDTDKIIINFYVLAAAVKKIIVHKMYYLHMLNRQLNMYQASPPAVRLMPSLYPHMVGFTQPNHACYANRIPVNKLQMNAHYMWNLSPTTYVFWTWLNSICINLSLHTEKDCGYSTKRKQT